MAAVDGSVNPDLAYETAVPLDGRRFVLLLALTIVAGIGLTIALVAVQGWRDGKYAARALREQDEIRVAHERAELDAARTQIYNLEAALQRAPLAHEQRGFDRLLELCGGTFASRALSQ